MNRSGIIQKLLGSLMKQSSRPASQPEQAVGELTELLHHCSEGNAAAREQLLAAFYPDLHRVAAGRMQHERPDHTLQPTALVNEFFLYLARQNSLSFQDRGHFLAVASQAMRNVLVDHARARSSDKRGGKAKRVEIDGAILNRAGESLDTLAVNEALDRLALEEPRMAKVVEMRCFGGLTHAEVATILNIDERTAKRDWKVARAWLLGQLGISSKDKPDVS